MASRNPVIAGNWKMYKTSDEAATYIQTLVPLIVNSQVSVFIAAPFTALSKMSQALTDTDASVVLGAQNMHPKPEGPYTGEISALMLKQEGVSFVILGHSERRALFLEQDAFINQKVKCALENGLQPLLCIGESLEQRKGGVTQEVLKRQLEGSLAGLSSEGVSKIILAYEPVWAIGSGLVAHPDDAEKAHCFCREVISETWGSEVAENLVILYGGSVKPHNAKSLLQKEDVDGLLVGGASLSVNGFSEIINTARSLS